MEPKIEERKAMILVGHIATGKSVKDIDISKTWEKFVELEDSIINKVSASKGYEVHILNEESKIPVHYCFVGIEVSKIGDIPIELFIKKIPKTRYVIFEHSFKDGGFGEAFKKAYQWIKDSKLESLGTFDIQFEHLCSISAHMA